MFAQVGVQQHIPLSHRPAKSPSKSLHPQPASMHTGLLFVTAPEADYKAVNLLIHHLRDWEYDEGKLTFRVVTTKNAYDLELPPGTDALPTTPPSLDATFDNSWAGSSLADVEAFCLDIIHAGDQDNIGPPMFVVADSEGFQARNAILVEQFCDDNQDFKMLDKFDKMRIPWDDVYISWCGIRFGNNFFDQLGQRRGVDEDADSDDEAVDVWDLDDWHDYHAHNTSDLSEKDAKRKEKAFQRLIKGGWV